MARLYSVLSYYDYFSPRLRRRVLLYISPQLSVTQQACHFHFQVFDRHIPPTAFTHPRRTSNISILVQTATTVISGLAHDRKESCMKPPPQETVFPHSQLELQWTVQSARQTNKHRNPPVSSVVQESCLEMALRPKPPATETGVCRSDRGRKGGRTDETNSRRSMRQNS